MSRRREAADLALALRLSTQESAPLRNPPYNLSSGSTPSRNSKEMELRECQAGYMGMPPTVLTSERGIGSAMGTVRPADVMMAPSTSGAVGSSGSGQGRSKGSGESDPILSNHTNAVDMSMIESFTPSHSFNHQSRIMVPASSGPSVPGRPAPHSIAGSPAMLPPATHLSSTEVSSLPAQASISIPSSDSSHRPLFTPTPQTNNRPLTIPLKTYGKQPRGSTSPQKLTTPIQSAGSSAMQAREILLSSSPADSVAEKLPNTAGPSKKRRIIDDSSDEEIEETIEERPSPVKTTPAVKPRSSLSVVLPSAVKSGEKQNKRHYSPDPLALVDKSPSRAMKAVATPIVASSSKSLASSSKAKPSGTAGSTSSRRISSRVKDNNAKAEKEKEEKREKRRREKEEKARREAEGGGGMVDRSDRKSATREKSGLRRGTSEVVDEPVEAAEEEEDDDVIILDNAPDPPITKVAPVKLKLNAGTTATTPKNKKRRADDEDDEEEAFDGLESVNGSDEEDFVPAKKGKKAKVKAPPKPKAPAKAKDNGKKGKAAKEVVAPEKVIEEETTVEDVMMESYEAAVIVPGTKHAERPEEAVVEAVVPVLMAEIEEVVLEQEQETPKPPSPVIIAPLKVSTARVNVMTPSPAVVHRPSPGPVKADGTATKPGGIKWKTTRSDLSSVLNKLPGGNYGARQSGMSKRLRIAPLHAKIGPPAKAKPPVPVKPVKKKKGEDTDEDEEEEEGGDDDEDDEEGKARRKKEKDLAWYMMED